MHIEKFSLGGFRVMKQGTVKWFNAEKVLVSSKLKEKRRIRTLLSN